MPSHRSRESTRASVDDAADASEVNLGNVDFGSGGWQALYAHVAVPFFTSLITKAAAGEYNGSRSCRLRSGKTIDVRPGPVVVQVFVHVVGMRYAPSPRRTVPPNV